MRRSPQVGQPQLSQDVRGVDAGEARRPVTVDLGLALSVYGQHADGSLFELGNPGSPLTLHSAAGTWPTEQ